MTASERLPHHLISGLGGVGEGKKSWWPEHSKREAKSLFARGETALSLCILEKNTTKTLKTKPRETHPGCNVDHLPQQSMFWELFFICDRSASWNIGLNWKVTGGKVEGHHGELRAPGAVPAPAVISYWGLLPVLTPHSEPHPSSHRRILCSPSRCSPWCRAVEIFTELLFFHRMPRRKISLHWISGSS